MKKFGICLVFVVVGMSCFAQSNNDAQRIVGTWVRERDTYVTYVFNANGTYSFFWGGDGSRNDGRYFISSGKLFLSEDTSYEYYLSSDGKVLYLISVDSYRKGFWFNKK